MRAVVSSGLAVIGLALAALTTISQSTGYPLLGATLLIVGFGAGLSFTVTSDIILTAVPKEQAGAASAVSETAYELGTALGIALLGSVVTNIYQDFTGRPEPRRRHTSRWPEPWWPPRACPPMRPPRCCARHASPSSAEWLWPPASAPPCCLSPLSPRGSCFAARS
nr:hypothetical protein GCM10020093_020770 [Planobispora longispora]